MEKTAEKRVHFCHEIFFKKALDSRATERDSVQFGTACERLGGERGGNPRFTAANDSD